MGNSFDPDAFLASGSAAVATPTPSSFNPDAFLAQGASHPDSSFNPDAFLAATAPPPPLSTTPASDFVSRAIALAHTPSPKVLQPFETAVKANVEPFIEHPIQAAYKTIVPQKEDVQAIGKLFTGEALKERTPIGSQEYVNQVVGYAAPLVLMGAGKAFPGRVPVEKAGTVRAPTEAPPVVGNEQFARVTPVNERAGAAVPADNPAPAQSTILEGATQPEPKPVVPISPERRALLEKAISAGRNKNYEMMDFYGDAADALKPITEENAAQAATDIGGLSYGGVQRYPADTGIPNEMLFTITEQGKETTLSVPEGITPEELTARRDAKLAEYQGQETSEATDRTGSLVQPQSETYDIPTSDDTPVGNIDKSRESNQAGSVPDIPQQVETTQAAINWQENKGSKIQAPISSGDNYVISHRPNRYTVSYRPEGVHENIGVFDTLGEAKTAAEQDKLQKQGGSQKTPVTSTKNVVTAAEREQRGIPPAEEAARRDFGTVWDEAAQDSANDPSAPQRLVEELGDKPRPVSDKENALVLRRQIELQNEHDAAVRAVNEKPGDATAEARLDRVRDDLQTVYDVTKSIGTETGRGLNARKMLADNEFTLAKMEAETRAVTNQGKPLSPKQLSEVAALHDRIKAAEARIADYETQEQFRQALEEAKTEARAKAKTTTRQGFLAEQAAKARERIVARRGRLNTGIDPTALVDEAIIGAHHISNGLIKFSDWSAQMVKDLGDRIKPYLADLWKRARQYHQESVKALAKGPQTPEEAFQKKIAADKKRIQAGTEKYQARTAAGDTSPLRPKTEPRMDKEKSNLLFAREEAKKAYHEMLVKSRLTQQPVWQKGFRYFGEGLRTSRSIKTSFDVSAMFRQGGFNYFGHPIAATRAIRPMLEAIKSPKAEFHVMEEIRSRPNYPEYKQAGLFIAEEGSSRLSKMEEVYASRLSGKIPGVAASERAYTTYLNRVRADRYDAMKATLGKTGEVTPNEAKEIANFVNVTTGRGHLAGKFQGAAETLNAAFFAPRYVISRFQTLFGQPLWHMAGKGTPRVRMLIAKEYARTLTGIGLFLTAAVSAGAVIETDPRSSDFLKLRFGNLRIDPMMGIQQVTVLLSRLLSGKRMTGRGELVPIRGKVKFGQPTASDVIANFTRTKLGPPAGAAVNIATGNDPTGMPTTAINEALHFALPLGPGDILSTMTANGVPEKLALALLAAGGMGVSNYSPQSTGEREAYRSRLEASDAALLRGNLPEAFKLRQSLQSTTPSGSSRGGPQAPRR